MDWFLYDIGLRLERLKSQRGFTFDGKKPNLNAQQNHFALTLLLFYYNFAITFLFFPLFVFAFFFHLFIVFMTPGTNYQHLISSFRHIVVRHIIITQLVLIYINIINFVLP